MIPTDAIAIVTPHGRYERVMRSRKQVLPCGHRTAMDEIAWQRDTKTQSDELPALVCNRCMKDWMAGFVLDLRGSRAGHQRRRKQQMKAQITINLAEDWFDDPMAITIEEVQEMVRDDPQGMLEDAQWVIVADGETN